jgi:four helix bundle protein
MKKVSPLELEERLIDFAVSVIGVAESLPNTRAGNHVAGQLIRLGTAPAPNYGEARSAESRRDFIHKMKIALICMERCTTRRSSVRRRRRGLKDG